MRSMDHLIPCLVGRVDRPPRQLSGGTMAALSGEAISKEIWESNPVSISTDAVSDLDTQRRLFYGPQNGGAVPEAAKDEQQPSREMKPRVVELKHQCAAQRSLGCIWH